MATEVRNATPAGLVGTSRIDRRKVHLWLLAKRSFRIVRPALILVLLIAAVALPPAIQSVSQARLARAHRDRTELRKAIVREQVRLTEIQDRLAPKLTPASMEAMARSARMVPAGDPIVITTVKR